MAKYAGHDVDLSWASDGGTVYTTIAQVIDLSGAGYSRNAIDSTTRDNTANWRTFLKGFKDAGEVSLGLAFDPSLASHGTGTAGLLSDFDDDSTIPNFRITFPDATTWTFAGFLTSFEPSEPLDDLLTADVTVKLSGDPTYA